MSDRPDRSHFDVTSIADASFGEQSEMAALDLQQVLDRQSSIDGMVSEMSDSLQETASGVITNMDGGGATHPSSTPPVGGQSAFDTAAPPIPDLEPELLRADAAVLPDSPSISAFDPEVRQEQPHNREDRDQMEMDNYQPTVIEPAADAELVTYEPEAEPELVTYEPEAEQEPVTYEPTPEPDYTVDMGGYAGPPEPDPIR